MDVTEHGARAQILTAKVNHFKCLLLAKDLPWISLSGLYQNTNAVTANMQLALPHGEKL